MSSSLPPERFAELCELIQSLHDQRITPEQRARLEQWLYEDEEACRVYIHYMQLYSSLHWQMSENRDLQPPTSLGAPPALRTPILGFLGDVCRWGGDYLSRGPVISFLLALGLPAVMILVLVLHLVRQPAMQVPTMPSTVARVTRTYDCVWTEEGTPARIDADLAAGRRLHLSEGIAELTFDDGTKVILQGPATFDTIGRTRGFLSSGSLVANVPKGAEGFAIETPSALIVDLGTEFGVHVEETTGTAEVHVFQGEVELEPCRADIDEKPAARRLKAGNAMRVEPVARKNALPKISPIAPAAGQFVRQMPAGSERPAIVADLSGGLGESSVDQFGGIPGAGWATPWAGTNSSAIQGGRSTRMYNTIEVVDTKPLRGRGNYLRFLATQEEQIPTPKVTSAALCRRFKSGNGIDITKPYLVSWDLRVDELVEFTGKYDSISVFGDVEWRMTSTSPTSGWAIRASGSDDPEERIPPRHWRFFDGDGRGGYRQVDSGIKLEVGRVYSFRVQVNPQKKNWIPAIGVDGGKLKTFGTMGIRTADSAKEADYWSCLHFGWQFKGRQKGDPPAKIDLLVDSIRIEQAEE
ncbi:MAG: FecR domain-containing protein [Pirellulales bacterium]|nr:FecR domain-containing protein [Pirellulales bacterium]